MKYGLELLKYATAGAVFLGGSSALADEPYVYSWAGSYIGVDLGAAFGGGASNFNVPPQLSSSTKSALQAQSGTNNAFVGGAHVGYNFQKEHLVFGLETEIDYVGKIRKQQSYAFSSQGNGGPPVGSYNVTPAENTTNYIGTLRARVGYAWQKYLVYAGGGYAYGGVNNGGTGTVVFTAPDGTKTSQTGSGDNQGSHSGYVLSAGVEYALSKNVSTRLDYSYLNFGNNTQTIKAPATGASYSFTSSAQEHFSLLRIGINYVF
jgi:outer membrane immunogenic protein